MGGIFRKFMGYFASANWLNVSVEMVEVNGVWVELGVAGDDFAYMRGTFGWMDQIRMHYNDLDGSGLDSNGVDRYDELYGNEFNNGYKKIDGKRL
jgi:hypothetical protein